MTKTFWEGLVRRITGYTCPKCNKRFPSNTTKRYCSDCGTYFRRCQTVVYMIPEVRKSDKND